MTTTAENYAVATGVRRWHVPYKYRSRHSLGLLTESEGLTCYAAAAEAARLRALNTLEANTPSLEFHCGQPRLSALCTLAEEIDVTCFVTECLTDYLDPTDFSCSVMQRGEEYAAKGGAWRAAKESWRNFFALGPANLAAAREHFKDYGAWDAEEIDAWTIDDLGALILQVIAADWQEITDSDGQPIPYADLIARSEAGQISSRLMPCNEGPEYFRGEWIIYIGN